VNEIKPGSGIFCLRCRNVGLRRLPESSPGMDFFDCPVCARHYARAAGKALTFRWLHPISLALHPVLFFPEPRGAEAKSARALREDKAPEQIAAMADEIELELKEPTQRVRDIIGNAASEEDCRAFLTGVVRELRKLN